MYWRVGETDSNAIGLPSNLTVTVQYEGRKGWLRTRKYSDEYTLTMDAIRGGTYTTRTTKDKELDRIAHAVEVIARSVVSRR